MGTTLTTCPRRRKVICKGFYPPLSGNCTSRRPTRLFRREGLANQRPLLRVGKWAAGTRVVSSLDSDLEAFSHNPAHVGFSLSVVVLSRLFDAPGRPSREPFPVLPRPACSDHSRRENSSSSPPTADGFRTGTPVPSPHSQSFSRGYGSILMTSLAYIVPSTRGYSPWLSGAVMSMMGPGSHSDLQIFKGCRGRSGHHATCGALPAAGHYLLLSRFQRSTPTAALPELAPQVLQRPMRPPTHQGLALAPTVGYPEENFGENQLLDSSISLSPLYLSQMNDLHDSRSRHSTTTHREVPSRGLVFGPAAPHRKGGQLPSPSTASEGGDEIRDARADMPPAYWLQAQLAFNDLTVHGILQFTPRIAFHYVVHRCESRDIHF
ncbi:hypothetical protein ACH5RR_026144 [Cinchona calisaya]|uniref:Uncharacterized protein n=1 Tax=Cinchona calisaya TaxID=153742 RepID=A0ABD2Z4X4_9GENT